MAVSARTAPLAIASAPPVPLGVVRAVRIGAHRLLEPQPARWHLQELRGRITELSGLGDSAVLSLALAIVLDAQQQGEATAWVTRRESCFYPPDAWACGVDLDALAVVRLDDEEQILRAADRLARSGGFGLVVCDLGAGDDRGTLPGRARPPIVPMPVQARLRALAARHDMAMLWLTRKPATAGSIGSLVSLHAWARRERHATGFRCHLRALKDRLRGPGWDYTEPVQAPDGLA